MPSAKEAFVAVLRADGAAKDATSKAFVASIIGGQPARAKAPESTWVRSDDRRLAAVFPVPDDLEMRVRRIMRVHPALTYQGAVDFRGADYRRQRAALLESLPAVWACALFLQGAPHRTTQWGARDSYSWKHRVEEWTVRVAGRQLAHIPNGAFVAAALLLGIPTRRIEGTPSYRIEIRRDWPGPTREVLIERGVLVEGLGHGIPSKQ